MELVDHEFTFSKIKFQPKKTVGWMNWPHMLEGWEAVGEPWAAESAGSGSNLSFTSFQLC